MAMTDEPRYPRVHVTQIVQREGRTLHEPVSSPVCDFCGHHSPAWDYDCHDFVISPELASMGEWAACTPCSDMIEADDWDGVMERCLVIPRQLGLEKSIGLAAGLMHAGFRENRYGERRAWG
jgi:hypothetical protein